jgi:hypothetical protein
MNRYDRFDKPDWVPPRSVKLLNQVHERVRYLHCSLQTEKAYVYWAKVLVLWAARSHAPASVGDGRGLRNVGAGFLRVGNCLPRAESERLSPVRTGLHPFLK